MKLWGGLCFSKPPGDRSSCRSKCENRGFSPSAAASHSLYPKLGFHMVLGGGTQDPVVLTVTAGTCTAQACVSILSPVPHSSSIGKCCYWSSARTWGSQPQAVSAVSNCGPKPKTQSSYTQSRTYFPLILLKDVS